jgi:uroporphyrinogen decarboxylase
MAEAVIDKLTNLKVAFWETALSTCGQYIDLVRESDDLGGQAGLLISPKMYRKYIKPAHRRICETIRKYTDAAICLHSCGSIWDLIPDIIDSGFTVLNPVQIGAARMDPASLKREFGRDLVFWGGSVDSQKVLPFASAKQVMEHARQSLAAFSPGGGYIFAPINMINADVPPQNIMALAEAVRLYGSY